MGRPFYHVHNTMALFLGVAFLVLGLFPFARAFVSQNWQRAEGHIVSSEVLFDAEGAPPMTFKARVIYRYGVNGELRLGSRVEFGLGSRLFLVRGFAERLVDRYPPGKAVSVFFDPANPADSVLERSPSLGSSMIWMILGVGLVATGLFVRFADRWE